MAGAERDPDPSLEQLRALLSGAHRSTFFAVMDQLERRTRGSVRVGGEGPVGQEAIRFRHDPNLAFSAGDISGAELREVSTPPGSADRSLIELTTTFLGLTGSVGPLPLHIADEAAQDTREAQVQRAFLDVFHHRLISLFYRSWVRYQVAREHEAGYRDAWSLRLLALLGVDRFGRTGTSGLPPHVLLRCAPMLAGRARTAHTLEIVLAEALEDVLDSATVSVEQLVGGWSPLDEGSRMRLGRANHALGHQTTIGSRVMDRGGHFVIRIGPLPASSYDGFANDGPALDTVRACVDFVLREPLSYDVELALKSDQHPAFRLSATQPARLGRATWLGAVTGSVRTVRIQPDPHSENAA